MADDSVVDNDRSKIVTKFILNTCRLLQPTLQHVHAAEVCARVVTQRDDDLAGIIPLTTGSVAEFYIQPMLSCVGDIDMMFHRSDTVAIPAGYPPPSQLPAEFHSRVKVCKIINSEYPGYVYLVLTYLLTENTDAEKYDAAPYNRVKCMSHHNSQHGVQYVKHGPALTSHVSTGQFATSFDDVRCIRCLSWPTQAAAYLHRTLRCKDSDSDSIYCLANVYLAVLYYTTGHYQTAIDHCTLVMRSQDH